MSCLVFEVDATIKLRCFDTSVHNGIMGNGEYTNAIRTFYTIGGGHVKR